MQAKGHKQEFDKTLIDYLVLAEFDINLGSIVRMQYPANVPQSDSAVIASYMLPEGGHNRSTDTTYFTLNRKKGKDVQADIARLQAGEGTAQWL